MSDGRRLPLLLNESAGRGLATDLARAVEGRALLEPRWIAGPDQMTAAAAEAARQGHPRVLVAGGDGTLHRALRGLAGTRASMGLIPCGTGNDLARALGLPLDPVRALKVALEGTQRRIDLARIDGKPFAGVAGIGIDGAVNRYLSRRNLRRRGPWIYPYALLRVLPSYEPPLLTAEFDGGRFEGRVMLAAVANSPVFGGGMRVAPEARLDDGYLDLVLVKAFSKLNLLKLLPRVYRGTHTTHAAVEVHRVRRVSLHVRGAATFFADGEPVADVGERPSTVEVWPGALGVVA
ncbi:MAG: diacylglycerol kinase family lipid kinase [bacterium]|nr:diacylglycerol kinase family lipid kinase [bacterium]